MLSIFSKAPIPSTQRIIGRPAHQLSQCPIIIQSDTIMSPILGDICHGPFYGVCVSRMIQLGLSCIRHRHLSTASTRNGPGKNASGLEMRRKGFRVLALNDKSIKFEFLLIKGYFLIQFLRT